jgi:hypothetical protein
VVTVPNQGGKGLRTGVVVRPHHVVAVATELDRP